MSEKIILKSIIIFKLEECFHLKNTSILIDISKNLYILIKIKQYGE